MKITIYSTILAAFGLLTVHNASAQYAEEQNTGIFKKISAPSGKTTFGVRTGIDFASVKETDETGNKGLTSFNLGLSVDMPLAGNIYLQSGLFFTGKGWKYEDFGEYEIYKSTVSLGYLQIPAMLAYHHPFSDALKLQIYTGPYVAYGVSGKVKWEYSYKNEGESGSDDAFGDEEDSAGLNRFDWGWNIGAGVTTGKFYIGLQYDLGLSNILNKEASEGDYSIKNRTFSINVGYNF